MELASFFKRFVSHADISAIAGTEGKHGGATKKVGERVDSRDMALIDVEPMIQSTMAGYANGLVRAGVFWAPAAER